MRGQNYALAYRAGQQWRPKQPDQRTITLAMWAAGVDQTSLEPAADQRLAFNNNFQQLRSLFFLQSAAGSALGLLTRRWYLTQNGSTGIIGATAYAEIAGTMEPTMSGRTRADFSVDFLLADPFFYGAPSFALLNAWAAGSNVLNVGDGAVGFGQQSGLGGVPFQIQLNGPLTNPVLTNDTANVVVSANVTIALGASLTLDVLGYTAIDNVGISHLAQIVHYGARPWMILLPGNNNMRLTSSNTGDTGNAVITWQPPYL